jgi:hypothetical protein
VRATGGRGHGLLGRTRKDARIVWPDPWTSQIWKTDASIHASRSVSAVPLKRVRAVRWSAPKRTTQDHFLSQPAGDALTTCVYAYVHDARHSLPARLTIIDSNSYIPAASIHYLVVGSHNPDRDNTCGA